jgi:hypothetical protein
MSKSEIYLFYMPPILILLVHLETIWKFIQALKDSTQADVNVDPAKEKQEQSPPPSRGHLIDGYSCTRTAVINFIILGTL